MAAKPPRTIVYIPIGQLSQLSLKRIRVVHVLDVGDKREIARTIYAEAASIGGFVSNTVTIAASDAH